MSGGDEPYRYVLAGPGTRDTVDDVLFEVVVWTREQGEWIEHDYGIVDCDVHDAIEFAGFRTSEDGQYELRVCYRDEATDNGMSVWLPEHFRGTPAVNRTPHRRAPSDAPQTSPATSPRHLACRSVVNSGPRAGAVK